MWPSRYQPWVARPVLPGRANDRAAAGPDKAGPATHEESALQDKRLRPGAAPSGPGATAAAVFQEDRTMARRNSRKPSVARLCQRFRKLYAAPIYDVLEKMGLPDQALSHEIKPLRPDMKVAGPVYTVKGERQHRDQTRLATVDLLGALKRHDVAVYAAGDDQSGHWGELTSNRAAKAGCQGIVVDGGVRDSTLHLEIPGWNSFCRYTSPIEAARRAAIVAVNEPILMSGSLTRFVEVRPGDFIFGDLDGAIIIPGDIVLEVLTRAEDMVERETVGRAMLWKGASMEEIARKLDVG